MGYGNPLCDSLLAEMAHRCNTDNSNGLGFRCLCTPLRRTNTPMTWAMTRAVVACMLVVSIDRSAVWMANVDVTGGWTVPNVMHDMEPAKACE